MAEKIKYDIEFPIQVSPSLLFQYLSSPSSLGEWFADNVNLSGDTYTFIWDGSEESAKVLTLKQDEKVKMRWEEDEGEKYFFEFKIQVDEITKDVSLIITDFAEDDEIEESKMLWEKQVSFLKKTLGSS